LSLSHRSGRIIGAVTGQRLEGEKMERRRVEFVVVRCPECGAEFPAGTEQEARLRMEVHRRARHFWGVY